MENETKISIIVPVFNIAPYIAKCIKSLSRQTFQEMEIILVDDGSTDESGKICDEFSQKDSRIIVIHKENGGLSSARNAGLSIASGKYIGFVDGDDWVAREMYQELYELAESEKAQIVSCQHKKVYENEKDENTENAGGTGTFTVLGKEEALKRFFLREISESIWDKLFLREMFEDIRFPLGEINEDTPVVAGLLIKSQKTVFVERELYFYRKRPGSITQSGYSEKFRVVDAHIRQINSIMKKQYPELRQYMEYFFGVHYFYLLLSVLRSTNRKEYRGDYRHYLKQFKKMFGAFMKWGTEKQTDRFLALLLVCHLGCLYSTYTKLLRVG